MVLIPLNKLSFSFLASRNKQWSEIMWPRTVCCLRACSSPRRSDTCREKFHEQSFNTSTGYLIESDQCTIDINEGRARQGLRISEGDRRIDTYPFPIDRPQLPMEFRNKIRWQSVTRIMDPNDPD